MGLGRCSWRGTEEGEGVSVGAAGEGQGLARVSKNNGVWRGWGRVREEEAEVKGRRGMGQ